MILVNPCCCKKKVYVPCETYTIHIEVYGCVNPPIKPSFFAGLPISVYASPGGLLLASGVTDSTGHLTLTWPGISPSPFWITAQSPWPDRSSSKAAWLFLVQADARGPYGYHLVLTQDIHAVHVLISQLHHKLR